MKIAWFTPFDTKSAIGQVSKLVCEELQKTCEVEIYANKCNEKITSSVPVKWFSPSPFDTRRLDEYDHVVYNMGNFAGNHRQIWEVMQRYPGILLQHDQVMQNFFSQITLVPDFGGNPVTGERKYVDLMRICYGQNGEAAAKALYKSYFGDSRVRLWDAAAALAYPLYEPLLTKATAVFSHAAFFIESIKDSFYGPTGYAYLPYIPTTRPSSEAIPAEFLDRSKALVVSAGIVHPVKRIDRVAEMLLANPDIARRVRYLVIGNFGGPYGDYLSSLASGPLKGCLYLLGYQPDAVLEAFLQQADFCINIRYPNSEVCSKSLIEQMAFENPVIVLNSGIFSEMPDDCVVKIHLENEIDELANAFHRLLSDRDQRCEIGKRAAEFVKEHCTPEVYAGRFTTFLKTAELTTANNRIVNQCIEINRSVLNDLSFNQQNLPWAVDVAWRQLSKVCGATPLKEHENKVLGVWLGFPYEVGLRREGIIKFLLYMLLAMLRQYPIECELWTYSINEDEIRASFDLLLQDERLRNRVHVITEKNFKESLPVPTFKQNLPYQINEKLDNLADAAREYSQASAFITAIVYLDNVIGTGKPLFVPVHDLGIHLHYDDFIAKDPLYKARHVDIRSRAENLARADAFMFSNSEYVRQSQVLKYVSSLDPSNSRVVYLPVNVPDHLEEQLLDEREVRQKFHLKKPYIFYPTQVRPYKNVTVLVEALSILHERNIDINLVLTGTPSDVPEVDLRIKQLQLTDQIICLSKVSEGELYSLYRYASAAAVPTLFEGGFPWQACEALFMDTPLVLSDIPVVRERITFCGMSVESSGLELFDPRNSLECANALERVLKNQKKTLESQKNFKDKFLSYSWNDAVVQYFQIMFGS